jgi:hypothetical protein
VTPCISSARVRILLGNIPRSESKHLPSPILAFLNLGTLGLVLFCFFDLVSLWELAKHNSRHGIPSCERAGQPPHNPLISKARFTRLVGTANARHARSRFGLREEVTSDGTGRPMMARKSKGPKCRFGERENSNLGHRKEEWRGRPPWALHDRNSWRRQSVYCRRKAMRTVSEYGSNHGLGQKKKWHFRRASLEWFGRGAGK